MKVHGFAAKKEKEQLHYHTFERREERDDDVTIEIEYCGVCHSDIHMVNNDWGMSIYPLVPGHEIVGRIISVGKNVTKFKVGQNVGVGCMVDSCQICSSCLNNEEQYCLNEATLTYSSIDPKDKKITYGGYSESIVVNEKFVLSIPDGLDKKSAAPILCAGITTWSPLKHWNVKSGDNVAIVGLGGLGHMGIKLAKALGANVTLFTRSQDKILDGFAFGADEVIISTDPIEMSKVDGKFDLIIDTVPYQHDINPYFTKLKINGTLVIVGLLGDIEPTINTVQLIFGRRRIAGSVIGGIKETQELLDFCGKYNVNPEVEMIDIPDINRAYQRMLNKDVKYRFVIDMSSLQKIK